PREGETRAQRARGSLTHHLELQLSNTRRSAADKPSYSALPPFLTSTHATRSRPLQAKTRLPSFVGIMLRTTPPPDGMIHVWNFSVFGSKRTSVFGLTADSLYHTMSFTAVMPYGWDRGPPGEAHSLTAPVFGSNRPRYPRE